MRTSTRRARRIRRASYWVSRLELALERGDLADAAFAQTRLRALGWTVAPRGRIWAGPGLDPDDLAQDLAAETGNQDEGRAARATDPTTTVRP